MPKGKRSKEAAVAAPAPQDAGDSQPVLDLRMDSSTPEAPREVAPPDAASFQTPCTLKGVMAGLSGGSLGWVFGFGGYWVRSVRGGGQLKLALAEGWGSAKAFGVAGGLYAAVSCFMQRLRQTNDAWNGAASGCATGLVLGWKQGPLNALQSCAMLGIFSFVVDSMGGAPAEAAAAASSSRGGGSPSGAGSSSQQQQQEQQQRRQQQRSAVELLLSPAVPLLAAVAPCAFSRDDSDGHDHTGLGCRVLRRRRQ